jgi:hypothetical protein
MSKSPRDPQASAAVPPRRSGPFDDAPWPEQLTAHVVTPGPEPRIHGYDVERDLARHYSFTETLLLTMTGELPTPARTRAFDVALQFLAPVAVNEAPGHAAVIARTCNAFTSAIFGITAITLAEQARAASAAAASPPADEAERASVERLREALHRVGAPVPALLDGDLGRVAALAAVLRYCGITSAEHIEAVMVIARLPAAIAEGLAIPAHALKEYPVQLPDVRYHEETSS